MRGAGSIVRSETGVTLTELVVVVTIIIIFAALSLPRLGSLIPDFKTRGGAEQVVEALRTARQSAIATTATYRVIFLSTTIQIICTDGTPAGNECPANRPPDVTESIIDGATLAATPGEMRFDARGSTTTGFGFVAITYPNGPPWRVDVTVPGSVRACEGSTPCS